MWISSYAVVAGLVVCQNAGLCMVLCLLFISAAHVEVVFADVDW